MPFKRMWYLSLADRLKTLYQSECTIRPMRWHIEHLNEGENVHPSDVEAWKHLQIMYPNFAANIKNIYFGLCTLHFNPFGKYMRQ